MTNDNFRVENEIIEKQKNDQYKGKKKGEKTMMRKQKKLEVKQKKENDREGEEKKEKKRGDML